MRELIHWGLWRSSALVLLCLAACAACNASEYGASEYLEVSPVTFDLDASSVAISPNGSMLALGRGDTAWWEGPPYQLTVGLRRTDSGELLHSFAFSDSASDLAPSIAFSPDGTLVAAATYSTVRIWEAATGDLLHTFEVAGMIEDRCMVFSPDCQSIAIGHFPEAIDLWSVATGEQQQTLEDDSGIRLASLAFSPDGTLLASPHMDGIIKLWHVPSGRLIATLDTQTMDHRFQWSTIACFSPEGNVLAAGYSDGYVRLWNTDSGEMLFSAPGPGEVLSLEFRPSGGLLAASHVQGDKITIWEVGSRRVVFALMGNPDAGWGFVSAMQPHGRLFVSCTHTDQVVRVWSLPAPDVPVWREALAVGDILACRSPDSPFLFVPLASEIMEWTHVGIYVGDGKVVEALGEGVVMSDITEWDYPARVAVRVVRVSSATSEARRLAASFAREQALEGWNYDFNYTTKSVNPSDILSRGWYCSELVWAAYMSAGSQLGLDLDLDAADSGVVTPDEVANSQAPGMVETVGGHIEAWAN